MTIEEMIKRDNRTWEEMSLRERVSLFLRHSRDCEVHNRWPVKPCDCGLSIVSAELDKILGG
jgi:hypothetical protein